MKQNIFETKQKADEMMARAVGLWQKSDNSENLEGLETDPVFKLMMNAVAYQSNELYAELETMKDELLQEFVRHVATGEGIKAVPATVLVRMSTEQQVASVPLSGDETFTASVNETEQFSFMPLLQTTVYNLRVRSVSRLDLRRWSVVVESPMPLTNLSGLAFTVSDASFRTLKVSIPSEGVVLPLIGPEESHNMPVSGNFSLKTLMFNRSQAADSADFRSDMTPCSGCLAMELFARNGSGFHMVDDMPDFKPSVSLELVFEFDGISKKFDFRYSSLSLNTAILVNAGKNSVTLSRAAPVRRLTGSDGTGGRSAQFLHLLPGDESSMSLRIQIRRICADRFNSGRLVGLLHNLISKFHSDYYAFQSMGATSADGVMANIRMDLESLMQMAVSKTNTSFEGVYAILADREQDFRKPFGYRQESVASMDVNYLTTDGAAANVITDKNTKFLTPQGILPESTAIVCAPEPGFDEIRDERQEQILMQYYAQTRDRLVTMYDIKLFCLKELYVHFNVLEEMVDSVDVTRRPKDMGTWHTYVIVVDIRMKPNDFVTKVFGEDTQRVENYLQKMVRVRMNGMYPVRVNFMIGGQA